MAGLAAEPTSEILSDCGVIAQCTHSTPGSSTPTKTARISSAELSGFTTMRSGLRGTTTMTGDEWTIV